MLKINNVGKFLAGTTRSVLKFQTCNASGSAKKIKKIGFIGLGNMGSFMSKNLIDKGFRLTVFDLNNKYLKRVEGFGAEAAKSAAQLASEVECIITMLPNGDDVSALYTGPEGILNTVQKGTLIIDSSTVDPIVPKTLAPIFKSNGLSFIDAPVSGGVMAAEKGTLTFMVGGDPEQVATANPILLGMGSRVIHCGEIGTGQVAKICNNMMLAISMIGLSEALNLAISSGLDPKLMSTIINVSSGRCWASEIYNPVPGVMSDVPSSKNYEPGFTAKMICKDLKLADAVAQRSQALTLLGKQALDVYLKLSETPAGDKDFSITYQYMKAKGIIKGDLT